MTTNGKPKGPMLVVGGIVVAGIVASVVYFMNADKIVVQPGTPPAPAETAAAPAPESSAAPAAAEAPNAPGVDLAVDAKGLSKATVTMVTTKGTIKYKFYSKDAPHHVARMVELIQKKFYDGLTFHRVVPGFVIQGGDPDGTGMGGSGQKLKAEFNDRPHLLGTVAMARAQNPDSADSQFYICLGTLSQLDHNYTVFGQVVEGIDVVGKIQVGDKMTSVTVN